MSRLVLRFPQGPSLRYPPVSKKFGKRSGGDSTNTALLLCLDARQVSSLCHLLLHDKKFILNFSFKWQALKTIVILVTWPDRIPFVYKSSYMMLHVLWEHIELDDALHWLSTLGGAFSNLGEHSADFAVKAGKNAFQQMQVALRSGDPSVVLRCWLFVAMSLIQQKRLRRAKRIIRHVFLSNKLKLSTFDSKINNMCLGIWARLRFAMHQTINSPQG